MTIAIKTRIFFFGIVMLGASPFANGIGKNVPPPQVEDPVAKRVAALSTPEEVEAAIHKCQLDLQFYQSTLRQLGKFDHEDFGCNAQSYQEAINDTQMKIDEINRECRLLQKRQEQLQ